MLFIRAMVKNKDLFRIVKCCPLFQGRFVVQRGNRRENLWHARKNVTVLKIFLFSGMFWQW